MFFYKLEKSWLSFLGKDINKTYIKNISDFIEKESKNKKIYPEKKNIFNCFYFTPVQNVKVVILGQDPYCKEGQANGLAFSVSHKVELPGSLRNIYKELYYDLGIPISNNGYLISWAKQGVLLLNSILTVEKNKPKSHANIGWESFTDNIIKILSKIDKRIIFVFWGKHANDKKKFINLKKNILFESSHPSPLSANKGFFGSRPFSKINMCLKLMKQKQINWKI